MHIYIYAYIYIYACVRACVRACASYCCFTIFVALHVMISYTGFTPHCSQINTTCLYNYLEFHPIQ